MDVDGELHWRGVRSCSIRQCIIGVAPSTLRHGKKMSADTIGGLVSWKNTL